MTRIARILSEAFDLVFDVVSKGKQLLIVGTKNKVADSMARATIRARCMQIINPISTNIKGITKKDTFITFGLKLIQIFSIIQNITGTTKHMKVAKIQLLLFQIS
ncbi:hypothetical protein CRYUN_Cryun30bG0081100 [Craigia yunnanensis]